MVRIAMKTKALAPWFGSNRMLAEHVGEAMGKCSWIGVPFAGGMAELPYLKARTIVANDLHAHIINLAEVTASPTLKPILMTRLEYLLFHPRVLARCQNICRCIEAGAEVDKVTWAESYFVCCWMSRASTAGTGAEFKGHMSIRWEAAGGDSCTRFRSATETLDAWHEEFKRVTFTTMDVFDFLDKCKDRAGHGIYLDPPFPGHGDQYKHGFTIDQHRDLAARLAQYKTARVVCRFYNTEVVQDLYPEQDGWTWTPLEGRTQANKAAPEVLLQLNGRTDSSLAATAFGEDAGE